MIAPVAAVNCVSTFAQPEYCVLARKSGSVKLTMPKIALAAWPAAISARRMPSRIQGIMLLRIFTVIVSFANG
jgi:hypothetical protein